MAWKRKSGVVSITTLWALYESRMEGLVRLSRGSGDSQTAQWQASVGTPMDVPEPKTVNWRAGISESRAGVEFGSSLENCFYTRGAALAATGDRYRSNPYLPLAFFAMASAAAFEISMKVSFKLPRTSRRS